MFAVSRCSSRDALIVRAWTAHRPLRFFAHSYGDLQGLDIHHYSDFLDACKEAGVPVVRPVQTFKSIDDVLRDCQKMQAEREDLPFEIDGVVLTQELLGVMVTNDTTIIVVMTPRNDGTSAQVWDVRVTNPDQKTAILLDAFTVMPAP